MVEPIPQEFTLAAACCRWPAGPDRDAAIREAATVDWSRFRRVVARHRVVGLVHNGLSQSGVDVPREIRAVIAAEANALAQSNLRQTAELLRLDRLFAEASLSMCVIKGTPFGIFAYGDLALRHSRDIDILVDRDDVAAALALLESAGYREASKADAPVALSQRLAGHKPIEMLHQKSRIALELHWELLTNPHYLAGAPIRTETIQIQGSALNVLATDDLFPYLCAHGAGHAWFRLKWLADIGALLAAENDSGVTRLYEGAVARGVDRPAAQALLLAERLLATRLPPALAPRIRERRIAALLENVALRSMVAGKAETELQAVQFGTTRIALASFLLGHGWRYRLAAAAATLRSDDDRALLPLPEWLHFLYPLLRMPLWLWRRVTFPRRVHFGNR